MGRLFNFIKAITAPKTSPKPKSRTPINSPTKRPLTPTEQQAIEEQIIIIESITRNN